MGYVRSATMASKVVLITAGTAGLGAQIARAFAPDFRVVCFLFHREPVIAFLLSPFVWLRGEINPWVLFGFS